MSSNNLTHNQKYYKRNKDILTQVYNTHNICDICGGQYTTINKYHHIKSNKHQQKLKENEMEEEINDLKNQLKAIQQK